MRSNECQALARLLHNFWSKPQSLQTIRDKRIISVDVSRVLPVADHITQYELTVELSTRTSPSHRLIFDGNCGLPDAGGSNILTDTRACWWVECPAVTFAGCLSPITHVQTNYYFVACFADYFCYVCGRCRWQKTLFRVDTRPATSTSRPTAVGRLIG